MSADGGRCCFSPNQLIEWGPRSEWSRVLAAKGRTGGFSAPGGAVTKRRLLALEQQAYGTLPLFALD